MTIVKHFRDLEVYISAETFARLDDACDKIIGQIVKMIDYADRWIVKPRRNISND
jgi:hypothetical protein